MKLKKAVSLASMGLLVVASSIIMSSCTCHINDEQLAKIAELRRQEKSLNSEILSAQSAKAKVEAELKARTQEANDCNSRLEIVKQRLSVWPNVWPDYTVQP
ncbi:MAG: hypothetical protein LBO69_03085 [Ignavibacteria bacterium]|jgi:outer membrane murein-binding lipoprotein Lpp|nr:hypothetical protein [Ignavibacteria bacterium]